MIKKFLIFLFVFGFLLVIPQEVWALVPPRLITPIILSTPTSTPTPGPIFKPKPLTTIILPPKATVSPTATSTSQPTQVLTSPTPQPTPTPQISPLPIALPSTNVWQLTTVGLAAAIIGGLIAAFVLKKGREKKEE